jgi:formamidopyrimidine-DNA glycosylase
MAFIISQWVLEQLNYLKLESIVKAKESLGGLGNTYLRESFWALKLTGQFTTHWLLQSPNPQYYFW